MTSTRKTRRFRLEGLSDEALTEIVLTRAPGELLTGGDTSPDGLIRPTVIARPSRDSKVECDEVFGPVCTISPVDSVDEAIERANATRFGLQAGIFTADVKPALRAARELEFGGVVV